MAQKYTNHHDNSTRHLLEATLELFLRFTCAVRAGKVVPWSLWAIMTAAHDAVERGMPRAEELLRLAWSIFDNSLPAGMRDAIIKTPLPVKLPRTRAPGSVPRDF
jgi:hypothetical protein